MAKGLDGIITVKTEAPTLKAWAMKIANMVIVGVLCFGLGWLYRDGQAKTENMEVRFFEVRQEMGKLDRDIKDVNWRIDEHNATAHRPGSVVVEYKGTP